MHRLNRRRFLEETTGSSLGAAGATLLASSAVKAAPSDRVTLCVVGIRGRGRGLAQNFAQLPNAQITYLCDVNASLLGPFGQAIGEIQKSQPKLEQDLRRVLDDRSVDAIVVATPDHWHALATIWACQAGKHVYVEKPISHNVAEGRQMVAAARKYNRVVQVGTQSRSVPHMIRAIDHVRSGKLGTIHMAKAWNSQLRRRVPSQPDGNPPADLDWQIWQGPAPERPYNPNRYTYGWRWLWDYGTGDMGNDGVHDLDLARWGLGVAEPATVQCTGAKLVFDGDIQETPDTQIVTFTFPQTKAILVYEQRLWSPYFQEGYENGVAFYGTEGYLLLGRRGWKIVAQRNQVVLDQQEVFSDVPHLQNFLTCVRSGQKPNCDIEEGHRSTRLAHLGNISYRVGRPLRFDGKTEGIVADQQASDMLARKGRSPFEIPDRV